MAAIGVWARADWRARWRALLALVLLAGVAGGVVMAGIAGARRTDSSLERMADATRSADALASTDGDADAVVAAVRSLPAVEHASAARLVFAVIDGVEVDVGLLVPADGGVGRQVERDRIVRGRRPDPSSADEVVVDESTARILGVGVGDRFEIGTLTAEQVAEERYEAAEGPTLPVRVVGISRGIEDLIGRGEGLVVGTPPMAESLLEGGTDVFATYLAIQARPGTPTEVLVAELNGLTGPGTPLDVLPFEARTAAAARTISALAAGLAVFAAGAALAAIVVVGQATARHVEEAGGEVEVTRALGMAPAERVQALAATALPAIAAAPLVAALVAVVASPLTPIGLARLAEPDPGVRVDVPVLLLGAAAVAVLVTVAATIAAVRSSRAALAVRAERSSRGALTAARAGAPPTVVQGIALALHRRGVALPSALLALTLAAGAAAAVVTYEASSDRLVADPTRWGSPWDLCLDFTSQEVEQAAAALAADPVLSDVARWDSGMASVEGDVVRAFAVEVLRGSMGFSLTGGRQPQPGEVVLGRQTADRLDVAIGDLVPVAGLDDGGPAELRIVGTAVFPEVDEGDFDDAIGLSPVDFADHATVVDQFEASQVIVRIDQDVSLDDAVAQLEARYEPAMDEPFPDPPGVVHNLDGTRSIPRALLVFVAFLAVATLVHVVRTALRHRWRHFATLRAVGMTPAQLTACSVAMALTLAGLGLVVGVPLGVAAGRATWRAVARGIGVADDPLVPLAALLVLAVAGVLLAVVTAITVGRPRRVVDEPVAVGKYLLQQ